MERAFPADMCFDFSPVEHNGKETAPSQQHTNRKKHIRWTGENTFQGALTSCIRHWTNWRVHSPPSLFFFISAPFLIANYRQKFRNGVYSQSARQEQVIDILTHTHISFHVQTCQETVKTVTFFFIGSLTNLKTFVSCHLSICLVHTHTNTRADGPAHTHRRTHTILSDSSTSH